MSDGNRDNGHRFGRRRFWGRDRGGQAQRQGDGQRREEERHDPPVECKHCGKAIFDLSSALADPELGVPIHFDCALQRIAERENLGPREKIVYIGSGAFAVVEFRDQSETAFSVKRRIPFEKENAKYDWRRGMSSRIAELGIMGQAVPIEEKPQG